MELERASTYNHSPFVDVGLVNSYNPPVGSFHVMQFDTVLTNEMGCWDAVNKWMVCPKAGRLQINTAVCLEQRGAFATGGAVVSELKVANSSGVTYKARRFGQYNDMPATTLSLVGSCAISVNYQDRVWLSFLTLTGAKFYGSVELGNVDGCYFTVNYIP